MRTQESLRACSATLALLLLCGSAQPAATSEWGDKKYGKTLVAEFDVPAETLLKWGQFTPSKKDPNESPLMNVLSAKTESWASTQLHVSSEKNPYTIVLKLKGRPLADGDVTTMWQAGWVIDYGTTRTEILPTLSQVRVDGGKTMMIAGATAGTRFKEDRDIAAMVGLVSANNWQFDAAKVEVWSGIGGSSWIDIVLSLQGAMIGIVLLGLTIWFRRR